jgi:hypothetical protein
MASPSFERMYGRRLTIDVCHHCQCLWFDDQEFLQMTPGATLQLVASVAEDRSSARQPWVSAPRCPRCSRALAETHDLQRNTRFTYHRCPEGHGRFITYYQFLRARNFVRPMSDDEVRELRTRIQQINCANCGAPVDVDRNAVCGHCRSPLAIIDPDQVRRTIAELQAAAEGKKGVDATLPVSLAMERLRAERAFADSPGSTRRPAAVDLLFGDLSDPVAGFLRLLGRLRT